MNKPLSTQNVDEPPVGGSLDAVVRPRRGGSSGLMQILAISAALGAPLMLPRMPSKGPREITEIDRENLRIAEERRARRLQKRQENQRRAEARKGVAAV